MNQAASHLTNKMEFQGVVQMEGFYRQKGEKSGLFQF